MSEFQLGFIAFLNEYYALSTGRLGYNTHCTTPVRYTTPAAMGQTHGISSKPVMVLQLMVYYTTVQQNHGLYCGSYTCN